MFAENIDDKEEEVKEEIKEESKAEDIEEKAEEASNETVDDSAKDKEFQALKEENKLFSNEIETLKDRLLRMTAEYENFRKRTVKEKEAIYKDSCAEIIKTILPVLDNLERAVNAEGDLESYKKGIEMTLRQFDDSFKKLDIEEIDTNVPFDPNFHEAVMHVDDENYGEKEIIDVFQKGYKKSDKIIRHSIVKVAN
ncbi:MAG: nucleotide exchange factor GrpE [Bacillota bacterium]|nr:nucleotide exchange factor GrpE [Bacillota bacterium]